MEDRIVQAEKQHLEQIKAKLSESLAKEKSALENQKKDLIEQRRAMWEDGAHGVEDFDDIVSLARYDERVREQHGHYVRIDKEVRQMTYLLGTPYFGRIDFKEKGESYTDEIYIGRYGFFDKKTYNCYIYDWRSPVASMFYDCGLGEAAYKCPEGVIEGSLTCKRQYQIEDGELKYCYDTNMAVQDELLGKVLSENTDKVLRVIIDTITKEQNKAIRKSHLVDLLVEGPAGSGKTSVGMHRLSYLLYHNRENLSSEKIAVLSRNDIFSSYISAILPELGEENINAVNFDSLIWHGVPKHFKKMGYYEQVDYLLKNKGDNARRRSICLKYSPEFLDYIEENYKKYKGRKKDFDTAKEVYLWLFKHYVQFGDEEIYADTQMYLEKDKLFYEDLLLISYVRVLLGGIKTLEQISHVVVDEAQDYCRVQLRIIKRLYSKSKFTIMADVNQAISPEISIVKTEEFLEIFGGKVQQVKLGKSYRSTAPINEFAFDILGIHDSDLYVDRAGKKPECIEIAGKGGTATKEAAKKVLQILESIPADKSVGILTCDGNSAWDVKRLLGMNVPEQEETEPWQDEPSGVASDAQMRQIQYILAPDKTLEEKIVVMPIMLAKGLEFDVVIVWDDRGQQYFEENRNLKYLMATRALHELYFVSFEKKLRVGVRNMDFSAFDAKKMDEYAAQAKASWGQTEAYKEFEQKNKDKSKTQQYQEGVLMMKIFEDFGTMLDLDPSDEKVQAKVRELQDYITDHFYTCSKEILSGLGKMYAGGGSMTENIDKAGGIGTAEFACKAIQVYCEK